MLGETSRTIIVAAGEGESVWSLKSIASVRQTGERRALYCVDRWLRTSEPA